MNYQFSKFSSLAFIKSPEVTKVGNYNVNTLSFCLPENEGKRPIIFLGGAFQSFISFKKDVQNLISEFPIILMDLPSQGSNDQLAKELCFEGFAHLIKDYCDEKSISKINLVGFSYGSAGAYYFSALYPERVKRLILGGTTTNVRDSYRILLKETFKLLDECDMEAFGTGVVMNLINYANRDITEISPLILKGFKKHMMKLSDNEKLRYRDNTQRLLELQGIEHNINVETLIIVGELDNFTTPNEAFNVYKKCKSAQMAVIKKGDHLSNIEQRETMSALYSSFFTGESISELAGITHIPTGKEELGLESRLEVRVKPKHKEIQLQDKNGNSMKAFLVDIGHTGCKIEFDAEQNFSIDRDSFSELTLKDHEDDQMIIEAHPLEIKEDQARFIFRKANFKLAHRMEDYISSLQ